MKELTENQLNFLLDTFFKLEKYPGWKNIATELLKSGSCVVAGESCIWDGGIGNFIRTSSAQGYFSCLLYEFDLDHFLSSESYRAFANEHIAELSSRLKVLQSEYDDICNLKSEKLCK